jgi:hypothetical protein
MHLNRFLARFGWPTKFSAHVVVPNIFSLSQPHSESNAFFSWDLQAQDRAFRLGQRRNVTVFRFIAGGTIEENQHLRQIYKQQLQVFCPKSSDFSFVW